MKAHRTSTEIKDEIVTRLGFFPPFFQPAWETPAVFESLWQQMRSGYLDNPLPTVFKEKLATLLSRYGSVNYCLFCHSSELHRLGMKGPDLSRLLKKSFLNYELGRIPEMKTFPAEGSLAEENLLASAVQIFSGRKAPALPAELRKALGADRYSNLILFLAYNQSALTWASAHPELDPFQDERVKNHFQSLIEEDPSLASYYANYGAFTHLTEEWTKLQEIFLQTPIAISIVEGPDHLFTLANPAYLSMVGGRSVVGKKLKQAFPDTAEVKEIEKILNQVYESGEIYRAHAMPVTNAKGENLGGLSYFDFVVQPFKVQGGQTRGLLTIASDVTEFVHAQMAAKRSAEQLQFITNRLPAFVAYMDQNRRYRFVNQVYENWFSKPACEIIGKTRPEFANPETYEISQKYDDLLFSGQAVRYENILRKPNGEVIHVEVEGVPDLNPETGAVEGAVIIGYDITSRKDALRVAEIASQEMVDLFTRAPVGICVFEGPKHHYVLANPTYIHMIFGGPREVLGRSIWDTLTSESNHAYIHLLDRVYQTGVPFSSEESKLSVPQADGSGREVFINFTLQPRKDSEGKIIGILAVVYEVTDQVLARKKVELAVQARDEFLSIASHELKTPLTSLQLQSQMMKRSIKNGDEKAFSREKVTRLVEQTDQSVQRLTRLVEDMFDIARISSGKLTLNRELFDLNDLAKDVIDRLSSQLQSANVSVSIRSSGPVKGKWDRFRLDQALTNLLTNAIRYGGGSSVEVKVSVEAPFAVLSVRDFGPGIAPENKARIFERFERAHSSSSITGLGLGLYITQEIVDRHGGLIRVESQLGHGAEFIIQLPFEMN